MNTIGLTEAIILRYIGHQESEEKKAVDLSKTYNLLDGERND